MTKIWQYKTTKVPSIVNSTTELDDYMNDIAKDGWENYAVISDQYGEVKLFWKRPEM